MYYPYYYNHNRNWLDTKIFGDDVNSYVIIYMIFLEGTAPTIEKEEKKSNDKFVFGLMLTCRAERGKFPSTLNQHQAKKKIKACPTIIILLSLFVTLFFFGTVQSVPFSR